MKTNKSRRDAASKAKKKAVPPQPAMFRLHSPVTPARVGKPAKADGDKEEAEGGATPEPPDVTSSDAPGEKPNPKSAKKPDDVSSLDRKPSAKKTKKIKGKGKEVNESDKDSITGEINNKKTPREGGSPDESSDNAPKNTAALFADSDDDDEPKVKSPRTAIKRPRNSASAEAYAKKMSEKEEAGMGEKSKSAKKRKEKKKGGEEAAEGHVKMKHTPKVPKDAPPRTKSARKKSTSGKKAAASAASNLKSPPEGLVSRKKSSRTKKLTEKAAAAAGLNSPPEAELSAIEKDTESDEKPEKKSSPRRASRSAKKSKANTDEKAASADALKSPPEAKLSAKEKDTESDEQPDKKSSSRKKPRSAKKSKAPAEDEEEAATGLKSPPEAKLSAKEKDTESVEKPEKKSSSRKKPRSAKKSKAPAEDEEEAATATRRSKRKTSAVAEELVSNLEEEATNAQRSKRDRDPSDEEGQEASDAAEEEATSARRSKRARKPSLFAEETKKNEAMALEAVEAVRTEQPSSKRKSPARTSSPREAKSAKKEGAYREFLEAKVATTWETRIALLKAHKELYNTCDLTHATKESIVPPLRNFVLESRKQYKKFQKGKHSTLTAARIAELRALGFDFCPLESGNTKDNHDRRFQQKWDEQFKELEAYKAEHGDCLVSCMGSENVKLGNWVRGQRKLYNKAGREGINPVRLAKLDEIGFDFDPVASGSYIIKKRANMFPRVNANWEKHYTNLVLYKKEHGNIIVSPNAVGWPGLYDWIHCQRKEYKKWEAKDGKALMYDTWITKMNEVGFDWAPMKSDGFSKMLLERQSKHFNDLWHTHYGELQKFHHKNGHCYISRNGEEEVLASWIHVQRKHKRNRDQGKKTPLTDERIKLLNDIEIDWNPSLSGGMNKIVQAERDKDWEGVFKKLCSFKKKKGHASPKKAEPQLGSWACRMRKLHSQKKSGETTTLTDAKVAKLESIGFKFATGV